MSSPARVPRVAVDAILLHRGRLVLVTRGTPPFLGRYALPGGGLEFGESPEDGVRREVREETGLEARVDRIVGVYGDPDRDPRGHTISIAYVLRSTGGSLAAGTDAAGTTLVPLDRVPALAFDHDRIVRDYRRSLTSRRRGVSTSPARVRGASRGRSSRRKRPGT